MTPPKTRSAADPGFILPLNFTESGGWPPIPPLQFAPSVKKAGGA